MGDRLFQFGVLMLAIGMAMKALLLIVEACRRDRTLRWVYLAVLALCCLFHLARGFG